MKTKENFTIEDLKKAFTDGELYDANELEFDTEGFDTAFDAWLTNVFFKEEESTDEPAYLLTHKMGYEIKYNPKYGNDRVCECGDPYYRHFDTYDDMYPCGCKYCGCGTFKEEKK